MTGLEQIVEQIRLDAGKTSEEQLEKTKQEADQIRSQAKKELEEFLTAAKESADAHAEQLVLRGQSAANLKERKMLLDAKQQIIQQIFEEAVDTILKLPAREYFEFLLHMVDRYTLSDRGIICLSKADLERVPEKFRMEMEKRQIQIGEEPVGITCGFILNYGEIEQNCSIEALLAANRESLTDQIVTLVFNS